VPTGLAGHSWNLQNASSSPTRILSVQNGFGFGIEEWKGGRQASEATDLGRTVVGEGDLVGARVLDKRLAGRGVLGGVVALERVCRIGQNVVLLLFFGFVFVVVTVGRRYRVAVTVVKVNVGGCG
jgi:hypothetical protein